MRHARAVSTPPSIPPTPAKRRAMQAQSERDTRPEVDLRHALHSRGLRYRLQRQVVPGTRRTVDVVFPRAKVAVDVRGCFWHACPLHTTRPRANADWWASKLARNVARDSDTAARLKAAGWLLLVVWEHEDPEEAAERIAGTVRSRALNTQRAGAATRKS